MLYVIGLGLGLDSISKETLEIVKKCKKVYLENYTVEFPYSVEELEKSLGNKILQADREFVENLKIVDEASEKDDAVLLVYGSPLTATTHITLLGECKKRNIECKVFYNASVVDAIAATGLQIYKFGKITSMPLWNAEKNFMPTSFMEVVRENAKISAHSLILIDIGLKFSEALQELEESAKNQKVKVKEIVVCSRLGTEEEKIFYGRPEDFKSIGEVNTPFCFIIPGKMHFLEKEFLRGFKLQR